MNKFWVNQGWGFVVGTKNLSSAVLREIFFITSSSLLKYPYYVNFLTVTSSLLLFFSFKTSPTCNIILCYLFCQPWPSHVLIPSNRNRHHSNLHYIFLVTNPLSSKQTDMIRCSHTNIKAIPKKKKLQTRHDRHQGIDWKKGWKFVRKISKLLSYTMSHVRKLSFLVKIVFTFIVKRAMGVNTNI